MTAPDAPDAPSVAVRSVRRDEVEELIPFLIRGRAHISGSRRPPVFRALLTDADGADPRTTVVVVDVEGAVAGVLFMVNSDLARYNRDLLWRHPVAAAWIVAHRMKKLPYRLRRRRRLRAADGDPSGSDGSMGSPDATPTSPASPAGAPPAVELLTPTGQRLEHGPGIAYCVYVLVDRDHRGRGLSKQLVAAALGHAKAIGATRYDCSFDLRDAAATRLYASLGFDLYLYPTGGFATMDLADVPPALLPR